MKSKKELYTTISAGKFKGKKLKLPSLTSTRSTKSILKESFFNTIQFDIIDKNFFEIFGGSGSMGLEAISRGAKKAYFIEKDKNAYKILQENSQSLDKNRCEIYLGDSFEIFERVLKEIESKTYFYFDPPFDIREGMEGIYERCFDLIEKIPQELVELIAVEHISSYKLPKNIQEYKLIKTKKFGKSSISYFGT